MSELTARETAVAAKGPVGNLGGNWMTTPAEEAATLAAGMQGWQLYFLGRHGVLGDVDADVITASAFFFPPEVVRRDWEAARALMTPDEAARRYVALCHEWGRERLSGFDDAHRLAELARQVADSADVAGLPLFAGWRAAVVPAEAPARCAHLMHVLREHRGACHGVAVVSHGLAPLTAVLANQRGADNAEEYGWRGPFPDVTDADRALRHRVEEATDDLVAQAYAGLPPGERAELLRLLTAAEQHAFPGGVVP